MEIFYSNKEIIWIFIVITSILWVSFSYRCYKNLLYPLIPSAIICVYAIAIKYYPSLWLITEPIPLLKLKAYSSFLGDYTLDKNTAPMALIVMSAIVGIVVAGIKIPAWRYHFVFTFLFFTILGFAYIYNILHVSMAKLHGSTAGMLYVNSVFLLVSAIFVGLPVALSKSWKFICNSGGPAYGKSLLILVNGLLIGTGLFILFNTASHLIRVHGRDFEKFALNPSDMYLLICTIVLIYALRYDFFKVGLGFMLAVGIITQDKHDLISDGYDSIDAIL